jgi:O-antigen ligase
VKKRKNIVKKNWLYLLPVVIFLYSVLILRVKEVVFDFTGITWVIDNKTYFDIFSYYKAQMIMVSVIFVFLVLIYDYLKNQLEIKFDYKKYLPFFVFAFFIVFLFSDYKAIAMSGMFDRYEGFFVNLSYIVMALYIIYIIKNEKIDFYKLIRIIIVLGLILGALGTLQYYKIDIFKTDWFKKIMVGSLGKDVNLNFTMGEGRVYLTVFNPNYVGVIMSTFIMISLNVIIFSKNKINKIISFISLPLMIISLLGSYSRSGMFALAVGLIVLIVFNYKNLWKYKYIFIVLLIVIIGVTSVVNTKMDNRIKDRFISIFKIDKVPYSNLTNIETTEDRIIITYNDKKYSLLMNNQSEIGLVLEDKEEIFPIFNGEKYYFEEEVMKNIAINMGMYKDLFYWEFKIDGKKWYFAPTDDGIKYLNSIAKLTTTEAAPYTKIFEGYERVGSGRIYIWSRSIPVIKERMITGYGPDIYTIAFPQEDHIYKLKFLRNQDIIVDKPHNMYLQYLINFGVPAFISFLFIILGVLYASIKRKDGDLYIRSIAISCMAVIVTVVFFNDSTVSTSPLMWSLIGIGYSQL